MIEEIEIRGSVAVDDIATEEGQQHIHSALLELVEQLRISNGIANDFDKNGVWATLNAASNLGETLNGGDWDDWNLTRAVMSKDIVWIGENLSSIAASLGIITKIMLIEGSKGGIDGGARNQITNLRHDVESRIDLANINFCRDAVHDSLAGVKEEIG